MTVPIQNVYYLLCYAWDMLEEGRPEAISSEAFQSMPDLFARVLEAGVAHLLKRGLDRGYLAEADDTRSLRGKFDLSETVKRNLLLRPSIHCIFDSLLYDVLHNRIIKGTLSRLARCEDLEKGLRDGSLRLYRRLKDISAVDLSAGVFDRVVLHRNNRHYAFLIEVCRILHESLLVHPESGSTRFRDFLRDESVMARLFERFVRNFYRREQADYRVRSEIIEWKSVEGKSSDLAYLPVMRTDVTLESASRKVVIDTKYYASTLQTYHGGSKVHSEHLYQLFAYLKNLEPVLPGQTVEGILLYPTVDTTLDLQYTIHCHRIRVATVDLNVSWREIRDRLLALVTA
jgi:5-methylcytosine-specific restriction enzyme subunit McrC